MWRAAADVDFEDDFEVMRRQRYNPFEDERENDFFSKYRFSKPVFEDLFEIVGPSLERMTARYGTVNKCIIGLCIHMVRWSW